MDQWTRVVSRTTRWSWARIPTGACAGTAGRGRWWPSGGAPSPRPRRPRCTRNGGGNTWRVIYDILLWKRKMVTLIVSRCYPPVKTFFSQGTVINFILKTIAYKQRKKLYAEQRLGLHIGNGAKTFRLTSYVFINFLYFRLKQHNKIHQSLSAAYPLNKSTLTNNETIT